MNAYANEYPGVINVLVAGRHYTVWFETDGTVRVTWRVKRRDGSNRHFCNRKERNHARWLAAVREAESMRAQIAAAWL